MPKATLYTTDGHAKEITPANGTDFTLDEMYGYVGDPVEFLALPSGQVMLINEEGKLNDLPKNEQATEIWKREYPIEQYPDNNDELIVGNAIVCDAEMVK